MAAKSKTTTRKKTKKEAVKTRAASKPSAKKASATKPSGAAKVAVKATAAPEVSLESRLLAPLAELESLRERFRKSQFPSFRGWEWPPSMDFSSFLEGRPPSLDIVDRENDIIARAELPGVDKDDLEINISDRSLTIKGETKHKEDKVEGDIHRREIRRGSFMRTVTLPDAVDGRKTKASYKDGVLELKMPKLKRSKKHSVKIG